jgi:hypothetical protein
MVKAIRASVLILLLACSAQAGEMPNDSPQPPQQAGIMPNGSPEPPPPTQPTNTVQEPTTGGDMPNDAAVGVSEIALSLLSVLPSLF